MQVVVKGKNLDVPQRVKDEAINKLGRVRKVFDRFIDMEVVFSEDKNPRIKDPIHVEVVLHAKGKYLRASASGGEFFEAIDRAEAKLARQVRKFKTRVVDRAHQGSGDRGVVNENGQLITAVDFAAQANEISDEEE